MTKGDNMNTKTTIQRISVITALALSVCTSSALAHHPDNKWDMQNGLKNDQHHSGNGSGESDITTITSKKIALGG